MEKNVLKKIQALTKKAKETKQQDDTSKKTTYGVNSLSDNIKTKEQAEAFKKMLKAL
jgi:hypothetical protein